MVQIRQNGVSRGQQRAYTNKAVPIYVRDDSSPSSAMQEGYEADAREVRKVQIGRYAYTLLWEDGQYWVVCADMERSGVRLPHGPFSEQEGHEFIEKRVQRAESLRRDDE